MPALLSLAFRISATREGQATLDPRHAITVHHGVISSILVTVGQ
jgi:hypothetical protein